VINFTLIGWAVYAITLAEMTSAWVYAPFVSPYGIDSLGQNLPGRDRLDLSACLKRIHVRYRYAQCFVAGLTTVIRKLAS